MQELYCQLMDVSSIPHCTKPYEVCRSLPNACVGRKVCLGILEKQFKYSSFQPGQLEAILPALHGEDVFVRMGTEGSGPCFQSSYWAYGTTGLNN